MSPPVYLEDDLFWLRSDTRDAPAVLEHLRAENAYTDACLAPLAATADAIFCELRGRLREEDAEVPWRDGAFMFYERTVEGRSYPLHCRRSCVGGAEEVVLDENELAEGHEMLDVNHIAYTRNHDMVAFSVDFSGAEEYSVHFRRLSPPGAPAVEELSGVYGAVEFDEAGAHVFYLTMDGAHRPYRLWRHALGTPQAQDVCLLQEDDERFWVWLSVAATRDYLIVRSTSKRTSEVVAVPLSARAAAGAHAAGVASFAPLACGADGAGGSPLPPRLLIRPREDGLLYGVEHVRAPAGGGGGAASGDAFVVLTNAGGAKNFKLVVAPTAAPSAWRDILPHSEARYLTGVQVRANFWAVSGREDGLANVWLVRPHEAARVAAAPGGPPLALERIPARDAVFVVEASERNVFYEAPACRFIYTSPTQPQLTCEAAFVGAAALEWPPSGVVAQAPAITHTLAVLKARDVPNFDAGLYSTARVFAPTADGRRVPISIVYSPRAHALRAAADAARCPFAAPAPLHLYAYGSYGLSEDPSFSIVDLSLCDRGVVHAIAHVRGGTEMGRSWYEDEGRLLAKKNTFSDYLACADHLVAEGWTRQGLIAAEGGSAAGILMGVAANERPALFAAVLASVPFVDAVVTMCDPSIPLGKFGWREGGGGRGAVCSYRRPELCFHNPTGAHTTRPSPSYDGV